MSNCWRDFVRAYRVTNPDITYKQALTEASKIYRREINNAIEKKVCEPVKRKKTHVNITKKQPVVKKTPKVTKKKKLVKEELEIDEPIKSITTNIKKETIQERKEREKLELENSFNVEEAIKLFYNKEFLGYNSMGNVEIKMTTDKQFKNKNEFLKFKEENEEKLKFLSDLQDIFRSSNKDEVINYLYPTNQEANMLFKIEDPISNTISYIEKEKFIKGKITPTLEELYEELKKYKYLNGIRNLYISLQRGLWDNTAGRHRILFLKYLKGAMEQREVYKDKIDEIYKKHYKKQPKKLVKGEIEIDEPIEYTSFDIRPKKKNNEYFKQCFKTISDTMDLIYSKSRSKNYDEIIKRLQKNRVFWDLVTTNDFYPTPPEVSKIIYDDMNIDKNEKIDIYDMTAGLGSLSIHFLENIDEINKITLIDIAKPFTDLLECFEKENNKVKVVNIDALEYDVELTPYKSNTTYFLCNPPFRANINGKFEKDAWIFFIFHIQTMIKNPFSQKAYFIVPKSTLFKKSYGDMLELTIPETTYKRIKKIFNIDDEYEDDEKTIRFKYIQDVKGFKKIGNMGKPTEVGITTMLIKTTY